MQGHEAKDLNEFMQFCGDQSGTNWNEWLTQSSNEYQDTLRHIRLIEMLTNCDEECTKQKALHNAIESAKSGHSVYDYCAHDMADRILREMICDWDLEDFDIEGQYDDDEERALFPIESAKGLWIAVNEVMRMAMNEDAPYHETHREFITNQALGQSLCPMHFCDYAMCFDDEDEECKMIRMIHPSHDT